VDRVYATCVAMEENGAWRAVLLRGPSGSGKSDLALRLTGDGARLVADDQTALTDRDGALLASAPDSIAGRLEVRGVGVVDIAHLDGVPVALVCDLCELSQVPRLPDAECVSLAGIEIPRLRVFPFESSAPAKVRLALHAAVRGIVGV